MEKIKNTDLAIDAFLEGKIGVFPTDTVWGVGCILGNKKATKRLYKIKRRNPKKPTAVLVASLKQAKKLGNFSKKAEKLVGKYWPGGLTLVVPLRFQHPACPAFCGASSAHLRGGGARGIGLRAPNHKKLLKIFGKTGPVMAASANFAGEPPPTKKDEINKHFLEEVDFLVEGAEPKQTQASTVVDTTIRPFKVLRQGKVLI